MKFVIFFLFFDFVFSGEESHRYQDDEHVVLWMNTVGPYHNRQETYEYFSLPFCKVYSSTGLLYYYTPVLY